MGKRTTTRHKEDNTFRVSHLTWRMKNIVEQAHAKLFLFQFETFEDKLKNISVSVNLSIRDGRTEVTDDESTYFYLVSGIHFV